MVEQEHDSLVLCLFVHAQVINCCKFLTTLVAHAQWMRMRWGWLNRSLRAWWSLLSGWTQLYLLWPSQASLYRRPIHQHPFFSLQQPAFHLSLQYILAKQWVLPSSVFLLCCVLACVATCHSRGKPPILCLTPLDFPPPWDSHAARRKGNNIVGSSISSAFSFRGVFDTGAGQHIFLKPRGRPG